MRQFYTLISFLTGNASQFESLFTYHVDHNESWQFFSHPNHTPVFADEIIATEEQVAICGDDSACLYDLSQTNSTAFAVETMHFGQANNQNVKLLSKIYKYLLIYVTLEVKYISIKLIVSFLLGFNFFKFISIIFICLVY